MQEGNEYVLFWFKRKAIIFYFQSSWFNEEGGDACGESVISLPFGP